jgi:hypothetical protein
MPFHKLPQFCRGNYLDLVTPLIEMPSHLDPAAGGKRDAQRTVWFFGDHLVGLELEFSRYGGRAGRKAPDDWLVFSVRVAGAEGLGGVGVQVEVGVAGEGLPGDLGADDAIQPETAEVPSVPADATRLPLPGRHHGLVHPQGAGLAHLKHARSRLLRRGTERGGPPHRPARDQEHRSGVAVHILRLDRSAETDRHPDLDARQGVLPRQYLHRAPLAVSEV